MQNTNKIDARGLQCPLPVLKLRKNILKIKAGKTVKIITTDPMAVIDIPHFCRENGHEILRVSHDGNETTHVILIAAGKDELADRVG